MGDLEKVSVRELDPLVKNIQEKKHSFRRMARDVVSLATELKEVRDRMASQEESFAREAQRRKIAETRARDMEEEVHRLQRSLEERNEQLQISVSTAESHLKGLENLREELTLNQEIGAEWMKRFLDLMKELDDKNNHLMPNLNKVDKLVEQLDLLQSVLRDQDASQKQLRDEVSRIQEEIKLMVSNSAKRNPAKNFGNIAELVKAQNEEIARLHNEIRMMSAHWKLKSQEMESLLEKYQRSDQELKKRVLKLEFCLQEARSQTRKLRRMEERRDKALKELFGRGRASGGVYKDNFWESSGFKIIISMTMFALVVLAKRQEPGADFVFSSPHQLWMISILLARYLTE